MASTPIHGRGGPASPAITPAELGFDPADPAFVADPYPVRGLRSLPVRV